MYRVVGNVRSRAFRVLWMLEELGVAYQHTASGPRSDEARRYNPSGKVPVLLVDDQAITDSTAIITYLADRHDAMTAPAGSLARARQDAVTHFLLDELDAVLWTAARHSFVLPEEHRVPAIKDSLRWEFQTAQRRLGDAIADRDFVAGDEMTVPDIIATHCATWALNARFELTDERVLAYLARMRDRPAHRRASAL